MRLAAISVVAWLTGFAAYVGGLAMLWGQTLSRGDLIAVLYYSALASTLAIVAVYAPAMFVLRRVSRGKAGPWVYALASMALGIVPVLLIVRVWGGNLQSLGSPEAALFSLMFGAFGFVFGHGFFLAYGRRSSLGRITFEP